MGREGCMMTRDLEKIFNSLQARESIRIEFYPYAGIKHSIRKREGKILIRISDTFLDAPQDVLLALGRILLAKLNKNPVDMWQVRSCRIRQLPCFQDAEEYYTL
jgi:hypothetical protein